MFSVMESQWHRARVVALNYSNKLSTIEHGHYMEAKNYVISAY